MGNERGQSVQVKWGVRAIIFGLLMFRERPLLKPADMLLALNSAARTLGVIGSLVRHAPLSMGTVAVYLGTGLVEEM